ncbi:condensation domain-containing protein [Lactiplantibacillus fabifermentans]|nr:condensation domain-containing protein [Lactiplantibacillus fabifermentans]ETY73659.1 hypothetical protein LFAB_11405 [Lactiplantibacillus fabifermentans T30PCM01]
MATYTSEPLNILHTIGFKELYPVIRCQLDFEGPLDVLQLVRALTQVTKIIPQLLCRYDLPHNRWQSTTATAAELIYTDVANPDADAAGLDWEKGPQLRCYLQTGPTSQLIIYLSHILTDGAGAKALLQLIAQAYNGQPLMIANRQDVGWLYDLKARVGKPDTTTTDNRDHPSQPLSLPALATAKTASRQRYVGQQTLSVAVTQRLLQAAHQSGVTLNDIIMACFGRAIQRFRPVKTIALACPTDLRRYAPPATGVVRIANHTARYNVAINSPVTDSINQTVHLMHNAMAEAKAHYQFFDSIAALLTQVQQHTDLTDLQQLVEKNYHVRPIAYTNFGIVAEDKIQFNHCPLQRVVLTGSFRTAPMFQIAASTFKSQLTIAFNMIGTPDEYHFGMAITASVADLMRQFCE